MPVKAMCIPVWPAFGLCVAMSTWFPVQAHAASLSEKDVRILARALGFLDPATPGGVIAVAYSAGNAASRADADAIAALFGDGIQASGASVTGKAVDVATLGDGSAYIGIIATTGSDPAPIMAAAKARHVPCVTGLTDLVASGMCMMSVKADPKVDITVNHAAAVAAGVSFLAAFRMLIHEI